MEFYTYLWLREDGTPYYAGKGQGDRAFRKGCPPADRIIIQFWPSEEDAFAGEKFLIALYGRKDNGTGILRNMTDGGEGMTGFEHNEVSRRKMSEKKMGNKINVGRVRSEDHLAKLHAKMFAPETAERLRNMARAAVMTRWHGKAA